MTIDIPKTAYNGKIREVTLGSGDKAVTIGGETALPFRFFEGIMPHPPVMAMEIQDITPSDWPPAITEPFDSVIGDPVAWAKKCINDYGAEMLCLTLASTDPDGINRTAEQAIDTIKSVVAAVDVPLIIWGTSNVEKDGEILTAVSQSIREKKLVIGPVQEGNYKKIVPSAIATGHVIAASSPIDINLAKQLNIQLKSTGVPDTSLIMDPTVSSIGYGIEYCYSVIERLRIAALTQQDIHLQYPIIGNIGRETWKTKEARTLEEENPRMGNVIRRGIMLESMSALLLILAGVDVVIMRHPESIRLTSETIAALS